MCGVAWVALGASSGDLKASALVRSQSVNAGGSPILEVALVLTASVSPWVVFRAGHPVNDHSEKPLPSWAITRLELAGPRGPVARAVTEQFS